MRHPHYPEIIKFKGSVKTTSTLSSSNCDEENSLSLQGDSNLIFQDNGICHCENDRGVFTFKKNGCLNCHGGGQDHFDKAYYDLGEHNYEDDIEP